MRCANCHSAAIRLCFDILGYIAVCYECYDGPGSPLGWGKTRQDAIADLRDRFEDIISENMTNGRLTDRE